MKNSMYKDLISYKLKTEVPAQKRRFIEKKHPIWEELSDERILAEFIENATKIKVSGTAAENNMRVTYKRPAPRGEVSWERNKYFTLTLKINKPDAAYYCGDIVKIELNIR